MALCITKNGLAAIAVEDEAMAAPKDTSISHAPNPEIEKPATVTEVGSSGLTKLLISRENELGLRGSPRGGPSEGRAGNQRDQRKSSDECLHDTSPCLDHRPTICASAQRPISQRLPSYIAFRKVDRER
jgi:hypothetical protein